MHCRCSLTRARPIIYISQRRVICLRHGIAYLENFQIPKMVVGKTIAVVLWSIGFSSSCLTAREPIRLLSCVYSSRCAKASGN